MVSNGWAQPNESLAENGDGWRKAKDNWRMEKTKATKARWDFCPGEKPCSRRCHWGRGYGALLSVDSRKLGATSLGASQEHGSASAEAWWCFGRVTP